MFIKQIAIPFIDTGTGAIQRWLPCSLLTKNEHNKAAT